MSVNVRDDLIPSCFLISPSDIRSGEISGVKKYTDSTGSSSCFHALLACFPLTYNVTAV